jgi:RNA polymerase sigma-70 factor (ECF subfamily)
MSGESGQALRTASPNLPGELKRIRRHGLFWKRTIDVMTFEQLYQTHFADVHRFALWLCRNPADADDLAAETFVRAWGQRRRLRTETLRGYLFAITRRLHVDRLRADRRRGELPDEVRDPAPAPDRRTAARLDLAAVRSAIEKLPELDRAALVLRAEHGLSHAEIARVLEISESAARVKVHRARRRLLDLYLPEHGDHSWT